MLDAWLDDQTLGVIPRTPELSVRPPVARRLLSLTSCFQASNVILSLESDSKNGVTEELAALAARLGLIRDKTWFVGALIERENVIPSATGNGIAFLHTLQRHPEQIFKPFVETLRTIDSQLRVAVRFECRRANGRDKAPVMVGITTTAMRYLELRDVSAKGTDQPHHTPVSLLERPEEGVASRDQTKTSDHSAPPHQENLTKHSISQLGNGHYGRN